MPVYNEDARLSLALDKLIAYMPTLEFEFEIIVSADGCTDNTCKIASKYAEAHPNVILVSFPERLGKGGGILNAAQTASGDVLIVMDVDLSTPLTQVPLMLKSMEEEKADIVFGSRNMPDSIILVQPPLYRKILGKGFNFLFRLFFGINIHDTQCGFKAFKRNVFNSLSRKLNVEGFAFDMCLAVEAGKHHYKIIELPIIWSHKKGSKVNVLKQIYEMGRSLFIVWLENNKRDVKEKPLDPRKFYDSVQSDVYKKASESWFLPRRVWHKRKNRKILDAVPFEVFNALDAGFGSGILFEELQRRARQVYGIDIGEGFVRFAHNQFKGGVKIIRSAVEKMPFRDGIFDCIVCSEVLEHAFHPAEAIKEMYRVVKSDGIVVITTPNVSLRWSLIEAVWTHIRREIIEIDHTAFTSQRLRNHLLLSGFKVVKNHVFMLGCLNFIVAKKPSSL